MPTNIPARTAATEPLLPAWRLAVSGVLMLAALGLVTLAERITPWLKK